MVSCCAAPMTTWVTRHSQRFIEVGIYTWRGIHESFHHRRTRVNFRNLFPQKLTIYLIDIVTNLFIIFLPSNNEIIMIIINLFCTAKRSVCPSVMLMISCTVIILLREECAGYFKNMSRYLLFTIKKGFYFFSPANKIRAFF